MLAYINLLCFANQFDRKISKLFFVESEYCRAITVSGQNHLKANNTTPSATTNPMQIHTHLLILLAITAYRR